MFWLLLLLITWMVVYKSLEKVWGRHRREVYFSYGFTHSHILEFDILVYVSIFFSLETFMAPQKWCSEEQILCPNMHLSLEMSGFLFFKFASVMRIPVSVIWTFSLLGPMVFVHIFRVYCFIQIICICGYLFFWWIYFLLFIMVRVGGFAVIDIYINMYWIHYLLVFDYMIMCSKWFVSL